MPTQPHNHGAHYLNSGGAPAVCCAPGRATLLPKASRARLHWTSGRSDRRSEGRVSSAFDLSCVWYLQLHLPSSLLFFFLSSLLASTAYLVPQSQCRCPVPPSCWPPMLFRGVPEHGTGAKQGPARGYFRATGQLKHEHGADPPVAENWVRQRMCYDIWSYT